MQTFSLYKGDVQLEYDDVAHEYFYSGLLVPNVTKITGYIDKSGPLMGWAAKEAVRYIRSNWPEGNVFTEQSKGIILEGAQKAYLDARKYAAKVGTETHDWIEAYLKHQIFLDPAPTGPGREDVASACAAFIDWVDGNDIKFLVTERKIFSKEHLFAGTLDAVADVNGVLTLIDFKTSASVYKEYCMQTAAYAHAYNEESAYAGTNHVIEQRMIVLLGKEKPTFLPFKIPNTRQDDDFHAFLSAKEIHHWDINFDLKLPNQRQRTPKKK